MRLDSVAVGDPDDPALIQFHPKLTVVSGLGPTERDQLVALIIGAFTGDGPELREASLVDSLGHRRRYLCTEGGDRQTGPLVDEAGNPLPSAAELLELDALALRRLMVLDGSDFSTASQAETGPSIAVTPELAEARERLASLEAELETARASGERQRSLRAEIAAVDAQLRDVKTGAARREYARTVAELDRVRAEANLVREGATIAEADRRFLAASADVDTLVRRWEGAGAALRIACARFGDRPRLSAEQLASALARPDRVPAELDELASRYQSARAVARALEDRLTELAADRMPAPSHPSVIRLAHADQDLVWGLAQRVRDAAEVLETCSVALGGIETEGCAPKLAHKIEQAHVALWQAEQRSARRRRPGVGGIAVGLCVVGTARFTTPALAPAGTAVILAAGLWSLGLPRWSLRAARRAAHATLEGVGAPSYLSFALRRVDAVINPGATQPLQRAMAAHREALASWHELAGEIDPLEAASLEEETRAYASSLAGIRDAAEEIASVRQELIEVAEPAVEQARRLLLEACAPFHINDAELAARLVREQVAASVSARLQHEYDQAEATAAELSQHLEARLAELGFPQASPDGPLGARDGPLGARDGPLGAQDGPLGSRLEALARARDEASRRVQARRVARPAAQVEADLARLEASARSQHRPEWDNTLRPEDLEEPDVGALTARREAAAQEHAAIATQLPDLARITDRRDALARRVAVLEAATGAQQATAGARDIEEVLAARLAAARRVGPTSETVPIVLNEPFGALEIMEKLTVLDRLERFSGVTQMIFVTDDTDTTLWARRHAGRETLTLLEPASTAT